MQPPYRQIVIDCQGDVYCARLRGRHLTEEEVVQLSEELNGLIDRGCRKLALSLGPQSPSCLYSVFLAKLVALQRHLQEHGGRLVLCDAPAEVLEVFEACSMRPLFEFTPDAATAVSLLAGTARAPA